MKNPHIGKVYIDYSMETGYKLYYVIKKNNMKKIDPYKETDCYDTLHVDIVSREKKEYYLLGVPVGCFDKMSIVNIPNLTVRLEKKAMAMLI